MSPVTGIVKHIVLKSSVYRPCTAARTSSSDSSDSSDDETRPEAVGEEQGDDGHEASDAEAGSISSFASKTLALA